MTKTVVDSVKVYGLPRWNPLISTVPETGEGCCEVEKSETLNGNKRPHSDSPQIAGYLNAGKVAGAVAVFTCPRK